MERTERFYRIERLLREKKVVTRSEFLDALEVSPATFKRDLEYMRDRLHAPIAWNPERNGYELAASRKGDPAFELPGLWFNPSEINALLTMDSLLSGLQPGLLAPHVEPLRARLEMLLEAGDIEAAEVRKRVRMMPHGARRSPTEVFETIAAATLKRRRARIQYGARSTGESTDRVISPQRLVHYRDNWYVDAWCHLRDGLRKFAIDAITSTELLDEKAKSVDLKAVEREFNSGYGVFAGADVDWAKLRFSAKRTRWVSKEQWHPQQRGTLEPDGRYVLEVPFTDSRELMMDVLKYGADVEVLGPQKLRRVIAEELPKMAKLIAS